MSECRLLLDPPAAGPWNMAVDEMLLDWSGATRGLLLAILSLAGTDTVAGLLSRLRRARRSIPPAAQCPVVRRLTGGGAILHDAELTYSLVVPARHPLAVRRQWLYQAAHETLVETLAEFGVAATLCRPAGGLPREPLLCFQRRATGDVLVGQTKIAGSAQRRRRGAVLQHGSVLLRRSAAAPELASLEDASGKTLDPDQLAERWLLRLAHRLAVNWRPDTRSPLEERRATELAATRYAAADWTERGGRATI